MVEVEVDGTRYILPVNLSDVEELKALVESKGGTIRPYILQGWDSFESLKRKLK